MAKIILITDDWKHIQKIQEFSQKEGFEFTYSMEKDWRGLDLPIAVGTSSLPIGSQPILSIKSMESHAIKRILKECEGNVLRAAQILKISRSTLYRRMKHFKIFVDESKFAKEDKAIDFKKHGKKQQSAKKAA